MSAFSGIGRWWKGLFDSSTSKSAGGLLAGVLQAGVAPRRGTRELLQAFKRLPYVASAFGKVANDVATVPLRLYSASGGRTAKAFARGVGHTRRAMMEDAKQAGDLVEVVSHPFLELMGGLNPKLRAHNTRKLSQLWLDLVGDSFWVWERNGLGLPVEAWPVPPTWIIDLPSSATPFFRASYLGWQRQFPEAEVLWMRHPDPENPYARGTGLGVALGDELDIDEHVGQYLKSWFRNGALPSALVSMDIAQGEMDRLKEEWTEEHRGPNKANLVKFVGAKDLKVDELNNTFKDQELTQLRKTSREVVMQCLNIPPECMGIIENSNRATIDAALTLYNTGVICPRLDFFADQLQPIAESYDERLVVDYVNPVPADKDFKQKVMVAVPTVFTVDEHRALAGAEPLPNGEGEELYEGPASSFGFGAEPLPAGPGEEPEDDEPEPDDEEKSLRGRSVQRAADGGGGSSYTEGDISRTLEALRPERLSIEVKPVWQKRLDAWGNRVLAELGVDVAFDIRNPVVRQHLEHFAGTKIRGVTDTTRDALRSQLTEGVALGEGIADLQKRVAQVFDLADKSRARRIARTEVVGSSNFANLHAFEQSGVVESKEWLAVPDENTRDTHRELDGQVVQLGTPFSANGHSAQCPGSFGVASEDINCFPGDTFVTAPARGERIYRRWYSGQMIEVATVEGQRLTGTPNHPVLTQRGWVPLGALVQSDRLAQSSLGGLALGQHVENAPTSFDEAFRLAQVVAPVIETAAGNVEQFHGDGRDGDVDVVPLEGELQRRLQPVLLKRLGELTLTAAELGERALTSHRLLAHLVLARTLCSPSNVRRLSEAGLLGGAQLSQSQIVRLASASHWNASDAQNSDDRGPGDRQSLGDAERAFAASVRFDSLASKRVFDWSGHVFNLQTSGGWYLANGIIAHNCRCAVLPVVADVKASADDRVKAWKRFDARAASWERVAIAALRRGFRAQEAAVLAAMS